MRKQDAEALVATLRAAYPNMLMPQATANLFVVHLQEVDLEVGKVAINEHISTSPWLPTISDLVTIEERTTQASKETKLSNDLVNYAKHEYEMDYRDASEFTRNRQTLITEINEHGDRESFDIVDWERRWNDPKWLDTMGNAPGALDRKAR